MKEHNQIKPVTFAVLCFMLLIILMQAIEIVHLREHYKECSRFKELWIDCEHDKMMLDGVYIHGCELHESPEMREHKGE